MTPLVKLDNFYLKREDQNLTGSTKDRAIKLQVQKLIKAGYKSATISSTGNAAISAAYFCQKNNINLNIFVSPKINPKKLKLLSNQNIKFSSTPIKDAFRFAKKNNAYFLRQSTDHIALIGYQQIGKELLKQLPNISSIFIPVGSGTTLLGVYQSFLSSVKVFAIQPANHCPIASIFDKNFTEENLTITDALGTKLLPLKNQLLKNIRYGLVVQNSEVISSQKYLQKNNILTSAEGALALAGLYKAKNLDFKIGDYPVVLLTGTER